MFICQTGFFAISSKQNQNINIYFIPTKKQKGAKAEAFLFQENLFLRTIYDIVIFTLY